MEKLNKDCLLQLISILQDPKSIKEDDLLIKMYKAFRDEYVKRTNNSKKLKKVIIHTGYGGFHLSPQIIDMYKDLTGIDIAQKRYTYNGSREDPYLIQIIESLPEDSRMDLEVVLIPADVEYTILEYDGAEWVAEEHRRF